MLNLNELRIKRDLLLKKLQIEGVGGVSSISIGGKNGNPVFVVDLKSSQQEGIPSEFQGFSVVVKNFGDASIIKH